MGSVGVADWLARGCGLVGNTRHRPALGSAIGMDANVVERRVHRYQVQHLTALGISICGYPQTETNAVLVSCPHYVKISIAWQF